MLRSLCDVREEKRKMKRERGVEVRKEAKRDD